MATSSITLPDGFVQNMMSVAGTTITNFSPLVYTVAGLLLAIVVIDLLIGMFRK